MGILPLCGKAPPQRPAVYGRALGSSLRKVSIPVIEVVIKTPPAYWALRLLSDICRTLQFIGLLEDPLPARRSAHSVDAAANSYSSASGPLSSPIYKLSPPCRDPQKTEILLAKLSSRQKLPISQQRSLWQM